MPDAASARPIRLGARTSPLARAQVDLVAGLLAELGIAATFVGVTTTGDVDKRHLTEIGGTGVFAGAVRDALHRGEIDVAVHSLKDLPTAAETGLEVIAVPRREDTRDVLIGRRLADLGDGTRVGTGAPRRAVQLEDWAARHGRRIEIVPIRGNVDTRIELARSGTVDAVVLAAAGLHRLGHLELVESGSLLESNNKDTVVKGLPSEILNLDIMLPAPGQGALGLEIHRSLSNDFRAALTMINNPVAQTECLVERAFLATLEAGCTAPVGARAHVKSVRGTSLDLTLEAVIGRTLLSNLSEPTKTGPVLRISVNGSTIDPAQFGAAQAGGVLAELRRSQDQ
ncbi:MAG TPA: hydroxymethylbilane synthase [Propionibacteriaceae bacterium]